MYAKNINAVSDSPWPYSETVSFNSCRLSFTFVRIPSHIHWPGFLSEGSYMLVSKRFLLVYVCFLTSTLFGNIHFNTHLCTKNRLTLISQGVRKQCSVCAATMEELYGLLSCFWYSCIGRFET